MTTLTQQNNHIGVWMDHQNARFVYRKADGNYSIETMESMHDLHPRIDGQGTDKTQWGGGQYRFSDNEKKKNHREENELHEYYKALEKVLENYDNIFLVGPTHAKDELLNLVLKNKAFDGKHVAVENSDRLTDHQLIALVKKHFESDGEKKSIQ